MNKNHPSIDTILRMFPSLNLFPHSPGPASFLLDTDFKILLEKLNADENISIFRKIKSKK